MPARRSQRLSSIYYSLGFSYKGKKDFDKADFYFQKVKEQYPTSFEADKTEYLLNGKKPDYYIIQLGAFRRLKNAKKLVRRLARKRYDSYIQKVKKGRVLYRVRGGKFSNIAERSGRAQDKEDGGGLETLRRSGYM